jgi:GT2 family glycosyltransferase
MKKADYEWYASKYKDVILSGIDPEIHYNIIGKKLARDNRNYNNYDIKRNNKLVSIIVINFNGCKHLEEIFESLKKQTYENFEVIFVDNNSSDNSVEIANNLLSNCQIIELKENVGFAEANNIGVELARGDYLALLNNDTKVDKNWLKELVSTLDSSNSIAAVCSKVLFYEKFFNIEIISDQNEVLINKSDLYNINSNYKKAFYEADLMTEKHNDIEYLIVDRANLKLVVPECSNTNNKIIRFLNSGNKNNNISIICGGTENCFTIEAGEIYQYNINNISFIDAKYVINNAGSELYENNRKVRDLGIFEFDIGQYDGVREISAFCGCSVLIRRESIGTEPLFCGKYFAYYEDTELSLRLTKSGKRLFYNSKSIVYHKHASTSKEGSAYFRFLTTRNQIYFLMMHSNYDQWINIYEKTLLEINHLKSYYEKNDSTSEELEFARLIPNIIKDLEDFKILVKNNKTLERSKYFQKIGIYNSFWHTSGGGEHHALNIASTLKHRGIIDLISENDFSIENLCDQFKINSLIKFNKKILKTVTEDVTSEYDIFINTSFCSSLISRALKSYYIISFPHIIDQNNSHYRQFLKSYIFLANSNYTKVWTERYWGIVPDILYPAVKVSNELTESKRIKQIVNVGRFFQSGHNKKQYELAKLFSKLKSEKRISNEWKLVLAGKSDESGLEMIKKIKLEFAKYNVFVLNNLDYNSLIYLYKESSIYWHATGLNEDHERDPHKFEHFGMTTVEAMSFGTIPIVYRAGGQPEIISDGENGYLFDDENELLLKTEHCIYQIEKNDISIDAMRKKSFERSQDFSIKSFELEFINKL